VAALNHLHLLRPVLLLALPIWLLLVYGLWHTRHRDSGWRRLCDPALLGYLIGDSVQRKESSAGIFVAWALGGTVLIVALAGPAWQSLPQPVYRAQAGRVIVLDLSRSMDAGDFKPSRLMRAKQKLRDILQIKTEGQTGLVVFAGSAFDVVPLTTDNNAILALLPSLDTSMMPSQGSRASVGLEHALAMLKRGAIRHGNVILLTDGVDAQSVTVAAHLAKAGHVLNILGVGTKAGAPLPMPQGGFVTDAKGNIVVPQLHESNLRQLALHGGGIYQSVRADDLDVQRLSQPRPERVKRTETVNMHSDQWREEGPWLVLLVLPLLALMFRRGVLLVLVLVPLLNPDPAAALEWRDLWQTPDQRGQTLLQQGNPEAAAGQFQDPAWKGSALYKSGKYAQSAKTLQEVNTTDGWFNRGNALAKAGQLREALAAYDQVLQQDPSSEDTKFNRALVEKLLKQQQQKQQQKKNKNQTQKGKQNQKQGKSQNQHQQQGRQQAESAQDKGNQSRSSSAQKQQQGQKGATNKQQPSAQAEKKQRSEQEQAMQNNNPEKPAQSKQEKAKQEQAKAKDKPASDATAQKQPAAGKGPIGSANEQAVTMNEKDTEQENARRQWLRRIPDDPGGLLRRKFRYQYRQQTNHAQGDQAW